MVFFLIGIGIVLWIIQSMFGFLQIKKFGRELRELRKNGKVAIGKVKGKFRAGCLVMLCIDENTRIIKGRKLEGVTSFARFKDFDTFNGILLTEISEDLCKSLKLDKQLTRASLNALNDYRQFKAEEIS